MFAAFNLEQNVPAHKGSLWKAFVGALQRLKTHPLISSLKETCFEGKQILILKCSSISQGEGM